MENEYALLMLSLREAGFSRAETLAITERFRSIGRDVIYWPRDFSVDVPQKL